MYARAAADEAADGGIACDAKAGSEAAAAATTGADAEAALRTALDAQDAAEMAEATAMAMSEAAIAAAMTELHIDGTVKTVGESSVDATTGTLSSPDGKMHTGFRRSVTRVTDKSEGQEFVQSTGPAKETKYKQAVAGGSIKIGKVLDTSDDAARLTLITSYQGTKKVRVFVDDGGTAPVNAIGDTGRLMEDVTRNSIGMYYQAIDRSIVTDPVDPNYDPVPPPTAIVLAAEDSTATSTPDELDAYDRVVVTKGGKAEEIFELSVTDNTDAANPKPIYVRVLSTTSHSGTDTPDRVYQVVDIVADASMTDGGDLLGAPDDLSPVKASIPAAIEYDHIHFGVWAGLGAADKNGAQELADLGIGFVQNHDGSGMTERQGIGTATFNGDWVAAVRRQYASDAEAGAIRADSDSATLTANFETGKFTGALDNLAMLEGTLSGNGFSGMTAKAINHDDLDAAGTFTGEFSGGIYGPTGSEAAGVFDFDGGEAGAFVGAFGGTQ